MAENHKKRREKEERKINVPRLLKGKKELGMKKEQKIGSLWKGEECKRKGGEKVIGKIVIVGK